MKRTKTLLRLLAPLAIVVISDSAADSPLRDKVEERDSAAEKSRV